MTRILSNRWTIAAGRVVNVLFFLTTSIYCVLTYSPFAYEQFIQPHVVAWLANFVLLYADFFWLALCVTMLTLVSDLERGRTRPLAWMYLAACAAVALYVTARPVLPGGDDPRWSLALALLCMVPVVWLALVDHLAAERREASEPAPPSLAVCAAAAMFVWGIYAAAAPVRLRAAGGAATAASLWVGAAMSAVSHLTIGAMLFLALLVVHRAARRGPVSDYWVRVGVSAAALALVLQRVVLAPISVGGAVSAAVAWTLGIALALAVSGIVRRHRRGPRSRVGAAIVLGALPLAAFAALRVVTSFDWGFMLQKLSALAVGCAAFGCFAVLIERRGARAISDVAAPLAIAALSAGAAFAAPRLPLWLGDVRLSPEFALDAYAAGDPAFRLARQALGADRGPRSDADFFAYLRANSSIDTDVKPASVDFVQAFGPKGPAPPNVFLFLIDSLRRDYLSPYNPSVTFTPEIARFARDSFVFDRVFSRYGGTGLAVPSIWAGAMLVHKQYVTPFGPTNALAKLLDADGYRRVISRDHITAELFGVGGDGEGGPHPSGTTSALDLDVPEMQHTFCGTIDQLEDDLRRHGGDSRPVFAHTRPLDLHIGNARLAAVPAGEAYPGFFEPYAARVHRIDACFGRFVTFLRERRLYDNSIVIVMSDHGDSLGEELRWGHGYTVFPEVLRIPLLMHVPASLRDRFAADLTQVSFATDVTPTLYALLGHDPRRPNSLGGAPLVVERAAAGAARRREAFLVASSYGAVYGVVKQNGRRLYIADAIEGRDYLYELGPSGDDRRIGLTDAERAVDRALIRSQIGQLASWYGLP